MEKLCATCAHWQKPRPTANWGTCQEIVKLDDKFIRSAYLLVEELGINVSMQTRDTFGCTLHEAKASTITHDQR